MFSGGAKLGGSDTKHEWSFRVLRGSEATFGVVDGQYDPHIGMYVSVEKRCLIYYLVEVNKGRVIITVL